MTTRRSPGHAARLTRALADPKSPSSLSARARTRRWAEIRRRFPEIAEMRVLDVGGTAAFWHAAPVRPAALTILNVDPQSAPWDGNRSRAIVGDACERQAELDGERFDLVVCNSVLGFVGGHDRRRAMAARIHEYADRHWVQTPNRGFPIEPCTVFPLWHFLPLRAQAEVCLRWPFGHRGAASLHEARELALTNDVLATTHVRHYFPTSELWRERMLGMTKSLVAIRA